MITVLLLCLLLWKLLCLLLRRRRSALIASLNPSSDCHAINTHTHFVDFPFLSQHSLEFGLFRTYAIPAISKILVKAGHFASNASKRYDDTDILIKEMILHHVDGDRGSLALRRLNFIHSHYPIQNAEYLYVLSVSMLLPLEWTSKYGYRQMTELEKVTSFKAWHDIGTRMGIQSIPKTLGEMAAFKEQYEKENMVYNDSNHVVAEMTMRLFLADVPTFLHVLARKIAYSLMDDRLLNAMGYPKQPSWLITLSNMALKMHGTFVSWMPPRPLSWAEIRIPAGCPASHGPLFSADQLYKLSFQRYRPVVYNNGYRITEIGAMRPRCLGDAFPGDLFFPLSQCNNVPWPDSLHAKSA